MTLRKIISFIPYILVGIFGVANTAFGAIQFEHTETDDHYTIYSLPKQVIAGDDKMDLWVDDEAIFNSVAVQVRSNGADCLWHFYGKVKYDTSYYLASNWVAEYIEDEWQEVRLYFNNAENVEVGDIDEVWVYWDAGEYNECLPGQIDIQTDTNGYGTDELTELYNTADDDLTMTIRDRGGVITDVRAGTYNYEFTTFPEWPTLSEYVANANVWTWAVYSDSLEPFNSLSLEVHYINESAYCYYEASNFNVTPDGTHYGAFLNYTDLTEVGSPEYCEVWRNGSYEIEVTGYDNDNNYFAVDVGTFDVGTVFNPAILTCSDEDSWVDRIICYGITGFWNLIIPSPQFWENIITVWSDPDEGDYFISGLFTTTIGQVSTSISESAGDCPVDEIFIPFLDVGTMGFDVCDVSENEVFSSVIDSIEPILWVVAYFMALIVLYMLYKYVLGF